jgi:predicted CXXCH cytochrome family protein
VRDCLTCHDPHTSDNKNQLLKPTSGEQKENLCLSCHQTGLNVPEKGSRHAALDMGCDTCHVTHKTGAEPTMDNRFHLTKAAPALCLDCHDAKDADLQKAHQNQPFATANCVECHDPHQSASPKLMAKFMHPPFEARSCDTCHAPAKDGKVVLTQADAKTSVRDLPRRQGQADRFIQGAASRRNGRLHRLPQSARQQRAWIAEDRRGEYLPGMSHRHWRFGARRRCTISRPLCRAAPHAIRRTAATSITCCGPRGTRCALSATVPIPLRSRIVPRICSPSSTAVKLPDDYYTKNKVPILPLRFGLGHPVEYHPVSDVMDPTNQARS